MSIDGADDVDVHLNLVKGGGGALLREKMVEVSSARFVCIVDESKLSKNLGKHILCYCYFSNSLVMCLFFNRSSLSATSRNNPILL